MQAVGHAGGGPCRRWAMQVGSRSLGGSAIELRPCGLVDASVELYAPTVRGTYRVYFRMVRRCGTSVVPFGDRLWAEFEVE